jgi:poly-beta-1,6-N-acetyl-D-glucosamine synthase
MMALLGFTAGLLAAAAAVVEGLRPEEGPPDGGALGAGTGRHELPAGPSAFVGRRVEIARALQLLRRRRDGAPAATITGMPGVGKTALALVLAHHLARTEYPDDQLFISLDSRLPVSPADALYDRLLAFGVPSAKIPGDLDGRRKLYLDALHGRRALVVLDDVTTAEQVWALWPPSGCAAIVTGSVELLKIFKDGAETLRLQPLTTLEAMRFLTNRIGRRRVVREPLAALRIVRACGRLPLALACIAAHLTAGRHRYLVLGSFARRLRDRQTRLDDLSVGGREGVEPALAQIYRGLNQYQRRVFDVIGHLDAPELDAELVAAVLPTTVADAESLLAELVDEGLLEVAGSAGERWQPHELVRVFACQVAPAEDRQAVVERAVAFHLKRVRNLRQVLAAPAARLDHPRVAARVREQLERECTAGGALVDQAVRHGLDLPAALVDELVDLLFQAVTGLAGCAETETYERTPLSRAVRLLADLRARHGTKDANRSADSERLPAVSPCLAEQNSSASNRRIVVLIPAHNEEGQLGMALESVLRQSRPVDRIIVISDNSTDKTVQVARRRAHHGVEVIETVNNTHRKAGALNQVLAWLLPSLSWNDAILEMDADTVLTHRYVERAEARLTGNVSAVGPAYSGRPDGGLLGVLQRNEYARFNRQIARRRGRTPVLSGTATLASVKALRSVLHGRQTGRLPNGPDWGVYNPTTGTEDYELTLCLRRLGYRPLAPANCGVITDVMDTLTKWHGQRVRWYWGAMTNLRQHGLNRITAPYFASVAATFAGIGLTIGYVGLLLATIALTGSIVFEPWWLLPTLVIIAERVWTVRHQGARGMLVAALFLPEIVYDWLRQAVWIHAALNALSGAEQKWMAT